MVRAVEFNEEVTKHSVHTLVFRSLKRTHDMFVSDQGQLPDVDAEAERVLRSIKSKAIYGEVKQKVDKVKSEPGMSGDHGAGEASNGKEKSSAVAVFKPPDLMAGAVRGKEGSTAVSMMSGAGSQSSTQIAIRKAASMPRPAWHAPWKLYRVISGHMGWVRCVAVESGNEWFATGAADRVIKIWDLASGKLKLSLTGHVSVVRGLAVSSRQPYLFSCGEDRQVKCWDLEYNKVIRHYHGHLSAVYDLALHPTLDVLVSCGRDSVARVWDMRTKVNIHTLAGHTNTVTSVLTQSTDPQVCRMVTSQGCCVTVT